MRSVSFSLRTAGAAGAISLSGGEVSFLIDRPTITLPCAPEPSDTGPPGGMEAEASPGRARWGADLPALAAWSAGVPVLRGVVLTAHPTATTSASANNIVTTCRQPLLLRLVGILPPHSAQRHSRTCRSHTPERRDTGPKGQVLRS